MANPLLLAVALAATLAATACSRALNTAPVLARSVPLDTITPWPSVYASEIAPPPPVDMGDARSVVTVDRRNWKPTRILVPVAGVRHLPHYTNKAPLLARETARQRGEFPTINTALEAGTTRSDDRQFGEIILAPVFALGDIILALPRMIATPPWRPMWSPVEPYERVPEQPLRLHSAGTTALVEPGHVGPAISRAEPRP